MKQDVINTIYGRPSKKVPRKERLNHYELLLRYGGVNPKKNLQDAYVNAVKALGIDLVSGVPRNDEASDLKHGEAYVEDFKGLKRRVSYMGVMPTYQMEEYGFEDPDDIYDYDPLTQEYHGLWIVTGSNDPEVIRQAYQESYARNSALAGGDFLTFPYFYTTLFMWGVETFGYENYMIAATMDPEAYDQVLKGFLQRSKYHVQGMLDTGAPVIVLHDDLAISTGPAFNPGWYEKYLYPKYQELLKPVKEQGKRVLLTTDGNCTSLIPALMECGFDGFEIECPAADLKTILDLCGNTHTVVGGMDNRVLTFGTPQQVFDYASEIMRLGREYAGFVMSNTGGIHGNIPMANLEAYQEAIRQNNMR